MFYQNSLFEVELARRLRTVITTTTSTLRHLKHWVTQPPAPGGGRLSPAARTHPPPIQAETAGGKACHDRPWPPPDRLPCRHPSSGGPCPDPWGRECPILIGWRALGSRPSGKFSTGWGAGCGVMAGSYGVPWGARWACFWRGWPPTLFCGCRNMLVRKKLHLLMHPIPSVRLPRHPRAGSDCCIQRGNSRIPPFLLWKDSRG